MCAPSAQHRTGFCKWQAAPSCRCPRSQCWLALGQGLWGCGECLPGRRSCKGKERPRELPPPSSARNLALLPPGIPESSRFIEICSHFSKAIRHVSGQQDSGIFSVPAFQSLGSRQGGREHVGLTDTVAAWPEACSVLESERSHWPLVECDRRFLFLAESSPLLIN